MVLDRDEVNGLLFVVEVDERLKNGAVSRRIEVVCIDKVHEFVEHCVGLEHTADNGLFGFQILWGDFT